MQEPETAGNAPISGQWQNVAERVAAIIRVSGIEVFRQAVREVAFDRLVIEDERKRRKEARYEALKKDGVQYSDGAIPERPGPGWFFHQERLQGSIKLPPEIALPPEPPKRPERPACLRDRRPREGWSDTDKNEVEAFHKALATFKVQEQEFWSQWAQAILPIFEHVKQQGFPNHEEEGFRYEFDVCAWLPAELHYDNDPPRGTLLPVPRRALTPAEKKTILAAVYDAHWRGGEKVAPWGLSKDGSDPEVWQVEDAELDEKRAALNYFSLFENAQQLDDSDLPVVESWLDELDSPAVLTPEERTILEVLADENLTTVTQEYLTGPTGLSDRTVRKYLGALRERDLVDQPRGPKKGYAITPAGLTAIRRE